VEGKTLTVDAPGVLANDTVMPVSLLKKSVQSMTQPAHGAVSYQADGAFTYVPAAGFFGTDSFTYRATDGVGLDDATVTLTVRPVNHAPSFVKGKDVIATDESPPQTIAGWAKQILPGPPNESGQAVAFTLTNDDNGLFAAQPAIDPSGTLTFTPKPNAHGKATVTVVLKDDGGTENGGSDTSAAQTFTIEVIKPHPLYNTARPLDATDDGEISPLDALLIINYLNSTRPDRALALPLAYYFDTNRDGQIAPLDALLIINYLNATAGSSEGEATAADSPTSAAGTPDLLALLGADAAALPKRKWGNVDRG